MAPVMAHAEDTFYTADPNTTQKGIIIVPAKKMSMSPDLLSNLNEQKEKGYLYKESNDAIEMIRDSKNHYASELNNVSDVRDTHMKSNLQNIQLAFDFKPTSLINAQGYAVGGNYIDGKGWTAISTFFNDEQIGACRYKINNMALTGGAVRIAAEAVRYDINGKVTDIFVEGSPKSGFMYYVMWNDNDHNYSLECANMKYEKNIQSKMISLAKSLDKLGNGLK
jgi:hypothetical protein